MNTLQRLAGSSLRSQARRCAVDEHLQTRKGKGGEYTTHDADIAQALRNRFFLAFQPTVGVYPDQHRKLISEWKRAEEHAGPQSFDMFLLLVGSQGFYNTCWKAVGRLEGKNLPVTASVCFRLLASTVIGANVDGQNGFRDAKAYAEKHGHPVGAREFASLLQLIAQRHKYLKKSGRYKQIQVDASLQLFRIMVHEEKLRPTEQCWVALLSTRESYFDGLKVFDRVTASGLVPGAPLYSALLRCCMNARDPQHAEAVFSMMLRDGVQPSVLQHAQLMAVYRAEGSQRSLEKLLEALEYLLEKVAGVSGLKAIDPSGGHQPLRAGDPPPKPGPSAEKIPIAIFTTAVMACADHASPQNYSTAKRAIVAAERCSGVDTSFLHHAGRLASKMGDLPFLREINEMAGRAGVQSPRLDAMTGPHRERDWSKTLAAPKEHSAVKEKARTLSLGVDLLHGKRLLSDPLKPGVVEPALRLDPLRADGRGVPKATVEELARRAKLASRREAADGASKREGKGPPVPTWV
ncbi:hypothetical protein DIPPA_14890 [Diplonema papillatum]|nr:hypothetical protein DIPPA_14890 [Diplonema papillatum]